MPADCAELSELHGNEIATLLIPTVVTLITARACNGADKVATIAWALPVSHEPSLVAVSIRPGGETARAMESGGCFVVNVLAGDAPALDESKRVAAICGRKHGVADRVGEAGLRLEPAKRVSASRVGQAISWIECELVGHQSAGDHELFIGCTVVAETRGHLDESGKLVPRAPLLMGQRGCFGHFERD